MAKEALMKSRSIAILALAALLLALPVFAAGPDGAALYKAKCTMCHGPDGSGNTSMGKSLKLRDLRSAEVRKQTDVELTKVISGGKGKMPPYGKQLSTADIEALIAYLRTIKAK
jgi:mono/diheme cytochrome c family protein